MNIRRSTDPMGPRRVPLRAHVVVGVLAALAGFALGCDATKTASECVAADLIGQCPAGSSPVLGAEASSACGGSFETKLVTEGTSATGQCGSNGSCEFLCQFEVPCTCGVATLTKEAIVCSECPEQSCGDGRCEGTERAFCAPGQGGCFECEEDCVGPTCGDGDCTGDESPDTCPQDCAAACIPNASVCVGTRVSKCAADGRTSVEFDCATVGQVCGAGACVAPGVCGNTICDGAETPTSCPGDCSTACQPASRSCEGDTLVVCAADGQSASRTDCAAADQICVGGQCRDAGVCGNGACEAGEAETCSQDCAATCGNRVCENNEETSCPEDCTRCGDDLCGAGEIVSCPQDCGVCVPSEKTCFARTLRVCNANGTAYEDVDCAALGLTCGRGDCVEPGVCGNGLCDGGETQATCTGDCAEVCGNGACAGLESFHTCAADCAPVCGDGTCEGNEDSAGCSFDCLASCGDGACAAPESRTNCPRDCGACGDGTCQDGFESASLNPPGVLESCVVDCVVTGCERDGDCDDDVACTTNQCLNGACIYTPDDALCSGDDRCIRFNGCCPDRDGDGYADLACGGSDCDDGDPDVHPGAVEACGGGDKNCNQQHKPALLPAKKITNTAAFKRYMNVFDLGDGMLLGWNGKPATREHLQLVEVGWDLLPRGQVTTVDAIEVNDTLPQVGLVWNPTRGKLAAWWVDAQILRQDAYGPSWNAHTVWLDKAGVLEGTPQTIEPFGCIGPSYSLSAASGVARGDTVIFAAGGFGYNGGYPGPPRQWYSAGWWELSAAGNALKKWGNYCSVEEMAGMVRMITLDGFVTGLEMASRVMPTPINEPPLPGNIQTLDPERTDPGVRAVLGHPSASGSCAAGSDRELLAVACGDGNKVWYHRATTGGGVFYTAEVLTGAQAPIAVGTSRAVAGKPVHVGVALSDAAGNLWFFVRDQAGEEVLEPAVIGGGEAIASAWVMHDGNDFVVVWLAKSGGFEQAFGQRVTCE